MNILTTDLRTFLPAKGVTITPEVDMEVANAAGDAYKIAAIREARMGDGTDGTIVGWTLFLRAGSA